MNLSPEVDEFNSITVNCKWKSFALHNSILKNFTAITNDFLVKMFDVSSIIIKNLLFIVIGNKLFYGWEYVLSMYL